MNDKTTGKRNGLYILTFFLLASPFYLNDFASIYIKDWRWWLFVDYTAVKLFPFIVIYCLISKKKMMASDFGLSRQPIRIFIAVFLITALIGTIIDQNAYKLMEELPGYTAFGGMPSITIKAWDWVDLTLGLLMVGIFEEIIFRAYLCTVLSRYTKNPFFIVALSSLIFCLIHWGQGLHALIITFTIGILFMTAYIKTRSIPAIMLAHFAVNFIDFAGLIPKSIFKVL